MQLVHFCLLHGARNVCCYCYSLGVTSLSPHEPQWHGYLFPIPMVFQTHASSYCISSFPCLCFLSVCQFPPFLWVNPFLPAYSVNTPPLFLTSIAPGMAVWSFQLFPILSTHHVLLVGPDFLPALVLALLPQASWHVRFCVLADPRLPCHALGNWAMLSNVWNTMLLQPSFSLSFFLYENIMPSLNLLINHCGGSFPQHLQCSILY